MIGQFQRFLGANYSLVISFELALVMVIYQGIHGAFLSGFILAYWCGTLTDLDRPLAYGFYTLLYMFI
jgi:hypothetical protein